MGILDFSKAFNSSTHMSVEEITILQGTTKRWINNFFKDQPQQVVVGNATTSMKPVSSGVPQGTVLRPTLFLIHINNNADITSTTPLLADDCINPYFALTMHEMLQKDLNTLD